MNGSETVNDSEVIDTQVTYKVACQEFPFKHLPESKELAKRDWNDEDGDDVYIPTDGLKFKAYDMEVKFIYVGTEESMSNDIRGFINFLYGRNLNGFPLLKIYDEYTKAGRRGVYVLSVDDEMLAYDDVNDNVIGVFKVKFRVTEPTREVRLSESNNQYVLS